MNADLRDILRATGNLELVRAQLGLVQFTTTSDTCASPTAICARGMTRRRKPQGRPHAKPVRKLFRKVSRNGKSPATRPAGLGPPHLAVFAPVCGVDCLSWDFATKYVA